MLVLVAALACALSGLLAATVLEPLRYDRAAIAAGQWWRLVSAHLVHIDLAHGAINGAALLLITWLAAGRVTLAQWGWLTVGCVLAVDAGLYWIAPQIGWYAGASGVLHGLLGGMAVLLWAQSRDRFGSALLLLLVVKVAYEQVSGSAAPWMTTADFRVITEAHLYGSIGGVASALAIWKRTPRM